MRTSLLCMVTVNMKVHFSSGHARDRMLQQHIGSIHADPCFSSNTDVLVHHGRHFGRTVHALCRVHTLLTNGIFHDVEQVQEPLTKEYGFYHPPLSSSFSQPIVRQQRIQHIQATPQDDSQSRGTLAQRVRRRKSSHC